MELSGHRAALPHEEIFSDQRLPGLQFVAGRATDDLGYLPDLAQIQGHRHLVQATQRERDLCDVGIARALAHAVDRALHPGSATTNSRDRGRCAQAEVIVAMPVHGHARSHPLANFARQEFSGFRAASADRVHHHNFLQRRHRARPNTPS